MKEETKILLEKLTGQPSKTDRITSALSGLLSQFAGDKGETGPMGPMGMVGPKGDKGDIGPKGDKGDKGDQGPQGERGRDGRDGKDGELIIKDKFTPEELLKLKKDLKIEFPNIKQVTALEVVEEIKKLKGNDRFVNQGEFLASFANKKKINTADLRWHGGGASTFIQLSDVPQTYAGAANKSVTVKADESGLEFTTNVSTDEKVKVTAADTTAGYLDTKLTVSGGIQKSVVDPAGNETLNISIDSATIPAPGSTTQVIYNNAGVLAGSSDFTWNQTTKILTLGATTATTQLILPLSNDIVTPTLAFGDGDSGFYEISDDIIRWTVAGSSGVRLDAGASLLASTNTGYWGLSISGVSATVPDILPIQTDMDTGIGSGGSNTLNLIAGGVNAFQTTTTSNTSNIALIAGTYCAHSYEAVSGAGGASTAVTATKGFNGLTSTGTGVANFTLADGTTAGQIHSFAIAVVGGGTTITITPANRLGFATITFTAAAGTGCVMQWTGAAWAIVGNSGGTIS